MPSIRTPASRPVAWHERSEWLQYAHTLFRYYSRSGRYVLRFVHDPDVIAAVDPERHRVLLNPDFPTPPGTLLEFVRAHPENLRDTVILYLHALLAHEAAHVLYSSRKPDGLLGAVWNAIEDERIERLMASAHPRLADAFTHVGDVLLTGRLGSLDRTPLEGVLFWRWVHDHPALSWSCTDEAAWQRAKPHVEAAWSEPDPERVVDHARAILDELGCKADAPIPAGLEGPELGCPSGLPHRVRAGRAKAPGPARSKRTANEEKDGGAQRAIGERRADAQRPKAPGGQEPGSLEPSAGPGVGPPDAPQVMPDDPRYDRSRELLREVEAGARALGTALALPSAPNTRISHQSRGRFDYGRYAQGAQRPFRVAHQPTRRQLPTITVLHDVSGSMGDLDDPRSNQFAAVRATMMIHRACERARTPFRLIAFDTGFDVVVEPGDDPEHARAAIANLQSRGGTHLAPALAKALGEPWPSRSTQQRPHLILVYCDGGIAHIDAQACRSLVRQNPSAFVLPVLIGTNVSDAGFQEAFGRALHVPDVTTLAARLRDWIGAHLP